MANQYAIIITSSVGTIEIDRSDLSLMISGLRYDAKAYHDVGMEEAYDERMALVAKLEATVLPPLHLRGC